MKLLCPQQMKRTLTLVKPKVIQKVRTTTIRYCFLQKDINHAVGCQNIFGPQKTQILNLV